MSATVETNKCTACGECVSTCPFEAIAIGSEHNNKAFVDTGTCSECGACVDVCPASAIEL
ncbi:MAG: 4Fe-4S binding protein [Planctomycetaceae bacterium]|jgi:NAD-dependent dihydropyrimidine dehydrogenase PreA subunit|nr:4Fe-4S binding protein [Planctomycetaceae bacterium]